MKILWAPWRKAYVENVDKIEGCFLCHALSQPPEKWKEVLLVYKGKKAFIVLNKYPYNTGHLMIVPTKHTGDYEDIDDQTALEMHKLLKLSLRALKEEYRAHGFNVGYNIGRAAGAGLEDHLHLHVVPRWFGDTNFMPVLAETKVISEALSETYERVRRALLRLLGDEPPEG
ncbi:MAG: HIT domain-containing protein [Aquificae bacterium]|nr:HIT domain-containing protein [Aquificota bacterium]